MKIGIWLYDPTSQIHRRYEVSAEDVYMFCLWAREQRVVA